MSYANITKNYVKELSKQITQFSAFKYIFIVIVFPKQGCENKCHNTRHIY